MRWKLRKRRSGIMGATALVAGMIVTLGLLVAVGQSHTSAIPALRRVQVFGTTLWVPNTWHKSISANGTNDTDVALQSRTITFTGRVGQLTLTRCRFMGFLPLVGNVPSGPFLPNTNSPYVVSWHLTIGGQPTYVAETTLPSGAGLALQLTWEHPTHKATRLSELMLTRVRFPAPLTITQAVSALRRSSLNEFLGSSATVTQRILDHHGRDRAWLLARGAPLANMSAWDPSYLFMTTNGGTTWHLIDYACSGEFMCTPPGHRNFLGQTAPTVMRFLSARVGILAQPNRIARMLYVYRTTDGGRQWTRHQYSLPNLPTLSQPSTLTESPTGLLIITVAVNGQPAHVAYDSANQGRTWHLVPIGTV